jgi:hypothetical protein
MAAQGPGVLPEGWLQVDGPVNLLGRFEFHSGACFDNWKVYADQVKADYEAELEARKSATYEVPTEGTV